MSQQDKRNFKCSVVYLKNLISKTADVSYKCKDTIFRVHIFEFERSVSTIMNWTVLYITPSAFLLHSSSVPHIVIDKKKNSKRHHLISCPALSLELK